MNLQYVNFLLLMSCLLCGMPVRAGGHAGHANHVPLSVDPVLDFHTVYEQAVDHAPESLLNELHQEQARQFTALGNSWLSGAPVWEIGYIDDASLDNTGLREMETGIRLPLWGLGQKNAARNYGVRQQGRAASWQTSLQWSIAGRMRQLFADIREARAGIEIAAHARQAAEELLSTSRRLHQSGAIPELDVMQAEARLMELQKNELDAEARLVDAERDYTMLTGLERIPGTLPEETLSERDEITPDHPMLAHLKSVADLHRAEVRQVRLQSRGTPELRIGVRRERGAAVNPYSDSLGVTMSIPFGGRNSTAVAVSNARTAEVEAEVALARARLDLDRALHETEHQLFLTRESIDLAERQSVLGRQRWEKAKTAFEVGESDMTTVILALQSMQSAEYELNSLRLREQRLVAEYNQTIGVLP